MPSPLSSRPPTGLPSRLTLTRDDTALVLTYRWGSPWHILILLAALGLTAVTAGMVYVNASATTAFYLVVKLGACYGTLGKVVNHTTITVTRGTLRYRHGPLPWSGNRTLRASAIEQLYCWARTARSRHGDEPRVTSYQVHAKLADGKRFRILRMLDTADQARYIEQQIEEYLGIIDVPEVGEIPR